MKRNLIMAIAAVLAIGSAALPSALNAMSPKTLGHYGPTCNLTRDCQGGSKNCGFIFADCTGQQLQMP